MTHSHECHVSSKYSIKFNSHHHVRKILPHGVLGKSKNASSLYVRATALYAPPLSVRSSSVRQFVCVSYCICIYPHTLVRWAPPPPQTHTKGVLVCMPTTIQTKTKKDSNKMYLGLCTCVSTHLIMACSKGNEAETTNQTRACARTETIRDILAKISLVYLFSLLSYAAYPICGEIRPY